MDFYTDISPYYDEIFPPSERELAFLSKLLQGKTALLDVGCATGNRTSPLSALVAETIAFDLDAAMIARAMASNARPGLTYYVLDMAGIGREFCDRKFDAIICLGNTLVHLASLEAITDFLRQVYDLLDFNGQFILQIINYDRILNQQISELPLIETDNLTFKRNYVQQADKFYFQTELRLKNENQPIVNKIELYPLRKKELCEAMEKAGFRKGRLFGSYEGEDWTEDSSLLILSAEK